MLRQGQDRDGLSAAERAGQDAIGLHGNVKDHPVIVAVSVMPVNLPVTGIDVDLYVFLERRLPVESDQGVTEIWSAVVCGPAGMEHFYGVSASSDQGFSPDQLLLPG